MNTLANRITLLRIFLVPFFLIFAYRGNNVTALFIYAVACASDFLDGYIARKYNQTSSFGKFADPLADKMLTLAAMCFLLDLGQMPGWAVAVVLFREFAVSGLRMLAAEKQRVIAAGISGKIKTFSTMICLGLMILFPEIPVLSFICWIIILSVTVFSGICYFVENVDILKDNNLY